MWPETCPVWHWKKEARHYDSHSGFGNILGFHPAGLGSQPAESATGRGGAGTHDIIDVGSIIRRRVSGSRAVVISPRSQLGYAGTPQSGADRHRRLRGRLGGTRRAHRVAEAGAVDPARPKGMVLVPGWRKDRDGIADRRRSH